VVCEILQPRLHYDVRRWATVFPLGMYAVASIALGRLRGLGWMVTFGHVFTWIALAVWALTLVGMLLGARGVVRTMT
jgi:tellurite resistance protein TehA-like permease